MQWDLSRSVPRKVHEVTVFTGDIQGLTTGAGRLFSCGADGSIRSWTIGKKGELTSSVMREKAHKDRVSAVVYKSVHCFCAYNIQAEVGRNRQFKTLKHKSAALSVMLTSDLALQRPANRCNFALKESPYEPNVLFVQLCPPLQIDQGRTYIHVVQRGGHKA